MAFIFLAVVLHVNVARASFGSFCLRQLQNAYRKSIGLLFVPKPLPMDLYVNKVSALKNDPAFFKDPRKAYKALRKFLMNNAKLSEEVASQRANEDVQSLLFDAKKANKAYEKWDPIALKIISDWDTSRMVSRAMDYVSLRDDFDAKTKAKIMYEIISSIPSGEQFRASYETVEVKKTKPSRWGHIFQGDVDELYIDPDGVLYKNIPGQQIKINSEGEIDMSSVRKREPKRRSMNKLFES